MSSLVLAILVLLVLLVLYQARRIWDLATKVQIQSLVISGLEKDLKECHFMTQQANRRGA
jgi:hypothetical protein